MGRVAKFIILPKKLKIVGRLLWGCLGRVRKEGFENVPEEGLAAKAGVITVPGFRTGLGTGSGSKTGPGAGSGFITGTGAGSGLKTGVGIGSGAFKVLLIPTELSSMNWTLFPGANPLETGPKSGALGIKSGALLIVLNEF